MKCKNCKKEIKLAADMGYSQAGTTTYRLSVEKNEIQFEADEFDAQLGTVGEWYCQNCNTNLPLTFRQGEKLFLKLAKSETEGLRQTNKNGVGYRWVFDNWQKDFRLEIIEDGIWGAVGHYKTAKALDRAIAGLK